LEKQTLEHMSAHSKLHKMTKTIFGKNYWRLTYCIMENAGLWPITSAIHQEAIKMLWLHFSRHLVLTCC